MQNHSLTPEKRFLLLPLVAKMRISVVENAVGVETGDSQIKRAGRAERGRARAPERALSTRPATARDN